ncbi:ATP-binding cassette domain-containing protein [Undibacterium sp. 5I1]|uniref:phosphonate ABC transporter ATP-binding protein n=1 Tax=Undibacterium sp. 5I1 TaxID=3048590 RepID=UPI002AB44376|nr:ATP-binding cassette domain-containing protein [Undibacterium sp. 5I1]MDY7538481.1 ATP-binding cassette domain-containing protein [Undibacterium sp. 5I1]MEB0255854.1 ATP-binding cassette domain-containing protein [Undibacterium sp. 5I1]
MSDSKVTGLMENGANVSSVSVQLDGVHVGHPASSNRSGKNAGAPEWALNNLTLHLKQGEQVAIIGPSGAGKTTLLHTLACALRPELGQIQLLGQQPWTLSHRARHNLRSQLFLAPQTPPLPARQRVITSVLAGCLPQWSLWKSLRSLLKPTDPLAAWQALSRFDLQDKLYARVDRLSGGERQRCALARLILSDAKLLLIDEPLSALDPRLAIQTLQTLQQEATQRQATMVCSLHQVELARQYFKRIIGLRDGKVFFDSEHVTDEMIAALYQNASADLLEPGMASMVGNPNPSDAMQADIDALANCAVDQRCF